MTDILQTLNISYIDFLNIYFMLIVTMIYILEDDQNIRKLIKYSLESNDFNVKDFSTPSEFWKEFNINKPDLILLDIMLSEEDGLTILKTLRSNPKTYSIPVIMITAKDSDYDVVKGLDSGADDYITKPFETSVLISRIKAVLRRVEKISIKKETVEVRGLKIDENRHIILEDSDQIFLTAKEFDLILLLVKNRGNVITRSTLLKSVWDLSTEIETRTIDVHIRSLRQKLVKYGKYIKTIRGVGYKYI